VEEEDYPNLEKSCEFTNNNIVPECKSRNIKKITDQHLLSMLH
jgi:hypothetical protein